MSVNSDTVDGKVPCGFSVQGKEYSHTATLDIISIKCSDKAEIVGNEAVQLACTISGSTVEPLKAVWYKGMLHKIHTI